MATSGSIQPSISTSDRSGVHTIQLKVLTLDQQTHSITIARNASVPELKQVVATKTGIGLARQRLIFRGKVLKNHQLIAEYALEDGHVLHLVARAEPVATSTESQASADSTTTRPNPTISTNEARPNRFVMGATIAVPEGTDIDMPFLNSIIANLVSSMGSNTPGTAEVVNTNRSTEENDVDTIINTFQAGQGRVLRRMDLSSRVLNEGRRASSSRSSNLRQREGQLRRMGSRIAAGRWRSTSNANQQSEEVHRQGEVAFRQMRSRHRRENVIQDERRIPIMSTSNVIRFLHETQAQMRSLSATLSNPPNTSEEFDPELDQYASLQRALSTWYQLVEQLRPRMEELPNALPRMHQNQVQSSRLYESRATIEMLSIVGNVAAELALLARSMVGNVIQQEVVQTSISDVEREVGQEETHTPSVTGVTTATSSRSVNGTGILQSIYDRMASTFRGSSSRSRATTVPTLTVPSTAASANTALREITNRWNIMRLWQHVFTQFNEVTSLRFARGDPVAVNAVLDSIASVINSGTIVPPIHISSVRTWSRRFWIELRHAIRQQGFSSRLLAIIPDNGLEFMNQVTRALSPYMPEFVLWIMSGNRFDEDRMRFLQPMIVAFIGRLTAYMQYDVTATNQLLEAILVAMGFGVPLVSLIVSQLLSWATLSDRAQAQTHRRRRRDDTDDDAASNAKRQRSSV